MTDGSGEDPRVRRRLEDAAGGRRESRGCLVWGAVLGVVVGAMFAFYGLPPILRHYYGETKVAAGATYDGDAKLIRVEEVARDPGQPGAIVVALTVRSNKTWTMQRSDWRLEVDGVEDWVTASETGGPPIFELGQEWRLVLTFEVPAGAQVRPVALHLATPRVRFALPAVTAP